MENTGFVGRRFEKLVVAEDSGKRDRASVLWRCKCDCGGEILAIKRKLTSGAVTNCGCIPKERAPHRQAEDLTGRQFGALTVLRRVENDKNDQTCWLCQCSCGNIHTVAAKKLKSGHSQSCGCRQQDGFKDRHYLEDTCIEALESCTKNHKNNTSGFRGVGMRNGKYYVVINFQKAHFYLGSYRTFSEAMRVRLNAEDYLHIGFVNAHQKWTERAELDPEWAEKNPFYYDVRRVNREFRVDTNGLWA